MMIDIIKGMGNLYRFKYFQGVAVGVIHSQRIGFLYLRYESSEESFYL